VGSVSVSHGDLGAKHARHSGGLEEVDGCLGQVSRSTLARRKSGTCRRQVGTRMQAHRRCRDGNLRNGDHGVGANPRTWRSQAWGVRVRKVSLPAPLSCTYFTPLCTMPIFWAGGVENWVHERKAGDFGDYLSQK